MRKSPVYFCMMALTGAVLLSGCGGSEPVTYDATKDAPAGSTATPQTAPAPGGAATPTAGGGGAPSSAGKPTLNP